jgi:hypothetical protein
MLLVAACCCLLLLRLGLLLLLVFLLSQGLLYLDVVRCAWATAAVLVKLPKQLTTLRCQDAPDLQALCDLPCSLQELG